MATNDENEILRGETMNEPTPPKKESLKDIVVSWIKNNPTAAIFLIAVIVIFILGEFHIK